MFVMAIWDSTAKFNSHQYFRLYGMFGLLHSTPASSLVIISTAAVLADWFVAAEIIS